MTLSFCWTRQGQHRQTAQEVSKTGSQIFLVLVTEGQKPLAEVNTGFKTCQKYSGAHVTTSLPRFLEAGKQSRSVGSSLWTPHPGAVPAETTLQGRKRDKKRGTPAPGSPWWDTLIVSPDLRAPGSTNLSMPLIISMVTGRYTTTLPLCCILFVHFNSGIWCAEPRKNDCEIYFFIEKAAEVVLLMAASRVIDASG